MQSAILVRFEGENSTPGVKQKLQIIVGVCFSELEQQIGGIDFSQLSIEVH